MTGPIESPDGVRFYMRRTGWAEQPPGPAGSLWRHPAAAERGEGVIAVPDSMEPDTSEWRDVVQRLARYESRPFDEVVVAIRHQFVDETQLSAANDLVISGSIPLTAGVSLLSSGYMMLRASATTSTGPRAHIGGNFSKLADDVARRARIGHTREGSYVIPLLMPLPEPPDDSANQLAVDVGTERIPYEPGERRVTRTLAQALAAVRQGIVEPAKEPRMKDMAPLVDAGVSRELVVALQKILDEPAVARFEAAFQWAGALMPPGGVPERVTVPADAAPLLSRAATLLKTSRRDPSQVITGPIVEVRHVPNDPSGEIAVQTMRRGRINEIRVRLAQREIDKALEWMRTARAVLVEGPLVHEPGHPLRIVAPTRVHPLDEAFLPLDQEESRG